MTVLEKLKVTVNRGKVNGAEYDGTRIIIQRGKRLTFTEDVKKASKVNEFKDLVKRAEAEHEKTAIALVEETVDVSNDELTNSVLRSSVERLNDEITERADEIAVELAENELRELRGLLAEKRKEYLTIEEQIENIKIEENHWRQKSREEPDARKEKLYEAIADIAKLKADELRLRANIRPEGELAQSIVEEEVENNDLTRFERFKRWTISIVAISVVGIMTTVVMGARNAVRRGARATSKFAKNLKKIAEKAAPLLGALLNLTAKVLTLGAKAIGFLSEHLWVLAVATAYILYKERRNNK